MKHNFSNILYIYYCSKNILMNKYFLTQFRIGIFFCFFCIRLKMNIQFHNNKFYLLQHKIKKYPYTSSQIYLSRFPNTNHCLIKVLFLVLHIHFLKNIHKILQHLELNNHLCSIN